MSELKKWFTCNTDLVISKYDHYLDVYERYFSKFVDTSPSTRNRRMPRRIPSDVVQLLWARASIHGLDINPNCKEVERNGVCIHIGDQTDCEFLSQVVEKWAPPTLS